MCFAPWRRALFRHLNFQLCSEPVSFGHFWLWNVPRATTACIFFISHLASPHAAALASLLFETPPEPQILENTVFRDSPTFVAHLDLFSETFSFWSSLFDLLSSSLLFSDSSHLCFSSVHVVGSLTSKLPSTIFYLKRGLNRHPLIKRAKEPKFFFTYFSSHRTPPESETAKVPPAGSHFGGYSLHSHFRGFTRVQVSMFYWFYSFLAKTRQNGSGTKDFSIEDIAKIIPMLRGWLWIFGHLSYFCILQYLLFKMLLAAPPKPSSI